MIRDGLTFNDVLLVPKKSEVFSRKDIDTKAYLTRLVSIHVPIVSANMDSVTEFQMARAMAENGGIGIIHRFLSIEDQVEEVAKVKRAENTVIEDPYTVHPDYTLFDARRFMESKSISGAIVVDDKKKLVGIITSRDLLFEQDDRKLVKNVMTQKVITGEPRISLDKAIDLLHTHRIEKLPLVTKAGTLRGLITLKDVLKRIKYPHSSKDKKGRLMVGAAVGVKDDTLKRTDALLRAGVDIIVVDIAHGHNTRAITTTKQIKRKFGKKCQLIAGNVATPRAAEDLIKAGADGIKVGIGPGAACTTRIVTGVGVPQLTAIQDVISVTKKLKIPIIADGGIGNSGDFAKAIAAGAQTAMIGSLLAGCEESPGEYVMENGSAYKHYRGMASYEASSEKVRIDGGGKDGFWRAPEGRSGKVPYRGKTSGVLNDLMAGLRSSMSYLGAHNLSEFSKNAEFIKMSPSGMKESDTRLD
ncbi:MAG: IMP dehydrogenase [bacterium]|nr:IMP dehydrogenase [bacterium]